MPRQNATHPAVPKRVVVWGTGFVGKMVIAKVVRHPAFELIGVGVHHPAKVGRDAGELCGIDSTGIVASDDLDALIALRLDALVHYGPTAGHADENIRGMRSFLRAGIDPGFANDLLPMTLMGVCAEVRTVRALEILDYSNYEGDDEDEMGIGRPPEFTPMLEHTDILVMAWGATVPMMAHAVGIDLDQISSTWEKWVTDKPITTAKGVVEPGQVAAIRFTINGVFDGQRSLQWRHPYPARTREPGRGGLGPRVATGEPAVAATPPPPDAWPRACVPSTRWQPSTPRPPAGSPLSTCH
jgi:4-hydroxy-tetrahydrodipicolinate reductase